MSAAYRRAGRLRAFFGAPIRYAWLTLLVPSLLAVKYTFGEFRPWPDYPLAWVMHFVPFACMVVPIQLAYAHLPERLRPADATSARAIPFHLAVIGSSAVVGYAVGWLLISPLIPPVDRDPTREWRDIPAVVFAVTLVGTPVALTWISYRERLQESRTRELSAQRAALAAQLQALQARIEPHFLFNSLNAVASLIGEDPERAERALEKIADLFRYALDASARPVVPLSEEIESVESFLDLERLRFPDQLHTSLRVEPGIGAVSVPPFLLQPLVENAVRHGVAARPECGRIEVEVGRVEDVLQVRVEDDGPGPGGSAHRGSGSALADLRQRLALLYGDRAVLEVEHGALGGFRATVRLPLHPAQPGTREEGA
jgi:two-component system sensor histidine kinase AlgZ